MNRSYLFMDKNSGNIDFESAVCFREAMVFWQGDDVTASVHYYPENPVGFKPNRPHFHDFFELVYVYRGEFINVFENGKEVVLDHGHLLLLNPYAKHLPYTKDPQDIVFNIVFKKSFVEANLMNMLAENTLFFNFFLDSIYGTEHSSHYFVYPNNPLLDQTILALITELSNRDLYYKQIASAHFITIFAQLARSYQRSSDQAMRALAKEGKISSILQYIDTNYASLTLDQLAIHFNYSTGYLSRMIKKHTGKNFAEIITNRKLEMVVHCLTNSNISTEQINKIVCYNDVSYLCKAFKKKYGVSPTEYRLNLSGIQKQA